MMIDALKVTMSLQYVFYPVGLPGGRGQPGAAGEFGPKGAPGLPGLNGLPGRPVSKTRFI